MNKVLGITRSSVTHQRINSLPALACQFAQRFHACIPFIAELPGSPVAGRSGIDRPAVCLIAVQHFPVSQ
ncbi:hypothetical protein [Spirosoma utsteinense]|uniref:Uncharacterized protein n=1 Tax=Spirosoma utsteinense TaxID=2585773 RepID=A0ABR6WAU9_9BACT|nr:hypothetical protein [Spirosoma utsteinense]MBC3787400.1 hypothetical protein [Spirosoma utsteinense]MBC3793045.1 hypothetical protein [Spirosoma utsteinense]